MQVALREAKRQNLAYRPFAIKCLGRVAAARTDKDMADVVSDAIQPVLVQAVEDLGEDAMDVDGDGAAADILGKRSVGSSVSPNRDEDANARYFIVKRLLLAVLKLLAKP